MTAQPSADLTDAEALTLARIEAEPDAPESFERRLCDVIYQGVLAQWVRGSYVENALAGSLDPRPIADAVLDVLRGTTDDAWIVTQLRALLREQDPDAVPIIARAELEAILDGDGAR